uniref:NADH-ubiquinone oxidoreductase chain 6 n=1 Tax=Schistometopum gregorii TaxID=260982 RepID=W5RHM2_9AMPH|nr:NADH dehydrogenase subunit 6 [Schistometopum gregorii]AGZ19109.1 NADH dehydrogenase subunit 6 [Schistometopum gregorii]
MAYMVFMGLVGLVMGMVGVASNPSPYYAALGLVVGALAGCWVLVVFGASFLSLVLFLIYLGGMLVVFAYSAAMAAEPYPMAWGDWSVLYYMFIYSVVLLVGWGYVCELDVMVLTTNFFMVRYDWGGVVMLYYSGGWVLLFLGWVLLITLFIVLEVTRSVNYGSIK